MSHLEDLTHAVLVGDVRTRLGDIPDRSVQCVVTSPPYYGHRDYSEGQRASEEIGCEPDLESYISSLVAVFRSVRDKITDDGLLWLNLGDTYREGRQLGVPWRVALALATDGWFLRSDIIWNKPNAMPSSVKSRPTVSHEYIFLLSKSASYFYDADAIREPHVTFSESSKMKGGRNHFGKKDGTPEKGKNSGNSNLHDARWDQAFHPLGRNKRTVWEIPLGKFRGAHFAVFPEKLVDICILAGSRPGDTILDPFAGSGTSGIVALKRRRNFIGIELYEHNANLIRERIADLLAQSALSDAQPSLFPDDDDVPVPLARVVSDDQ